MKKGMVLKIRQNNAIIMADDCNFYEVKAFEGIYKGMEICFDDNDIIRTKKHSKNRRYINAASFIFFILCGYLFFSFYQNNYAAYAYVGIEINPEIEIALNKKEKIIAVRGKDENGKRIISDLDVNKMDGIAGVKKIINKAIEENYLSPDKNNEIVVYAVMNNDNNNNGDILVNKIENAIEEEVANNSLKSDVKTLVINKNIRKSADVKGISVTQYVFEESNIEQNSNNIKENSNKNNEKLIKKEKKGNKGNGKDKAISEDKENSKKEKKNNKTNNDKNKNNKIDNPSFSKEKVEKAKQKVDHKEKDMNKEKDQDKDRNNNKDKDKNMDRDRDKSKDDKGKDGKAKFKNKKE